MVKPLLDTNILIDYLLNYDEARREIALYRSASISIVSWMGVMAGTDRRTEEGTRRFLQRFERIELDAAIAEAAVQVRRDRRLKLPDLIIWATAASRSMLLVTRNTKDFPADQPWVRVPYSLPS